ncbi:ras-related protein Rab-3C isoform X3 [Chrysemys picta bellii]|uniref:ras-related protein Rab-3C isoform X3 n=1 Tax=Chrysemys picta bellii TaxID=8478 RepID=UPI0032B2C150
MRHEAPMQMASAQDSRYGQKDTSDQNFDYMFKLLIIGNSSVGKTSFLFRYADDSFTSAFVSTVGIDFKVKTVFKNEKRIKLQIWQVTMSDITLMRISETEKERMLRECQQTPGPYAAMLCEAMIPEYLLLAWRGKVFYHGGCNKAALPRDLMQRLSQYLQESFVEMSQEDFCSIPGHIYRIFQ